MIDLEVERQSLLFDDPLILPAAALLETRHYLGPAGRGRVYRDQYGLMVFASPTSRRLPTARWLELSRWCLVGGKNAGTRQWSAARRWLLDGYPSVTTVVSYSDPSVGHTGALYRACSWLWAPTWMRLRPPPTGSGSWDGCRRQGVKDRWIAVLRPDDEREGILAVNDAGLLRRFPWASYREPVWVRGRPRGGGGDFQRWRTA